MQASLSGRLLEDTYTYLSGGTVLAAVVEEDLQFK
eukprot:COSAG01_NODE_3616_length_5864_cov_26.225499_2_plen_35_part_00